MKHYSRIIILSLYGFLVCGLIYCSLSSPKRFESFCDRFFQEEMSANSLTLHYTLENPKNYGITQDEITLGSYSSDTRPYQKWLRGKSFTLQTIARGMLSDKQQITYDLLKYLLKTESQSTDFTLLQEPLVPSIGIQSQLPVLLAEYSFRDEQDVKDYLQLLACIPEYFNSLIVLEEIRSEEGLLPDPESVQELITYCSEFLSDKDTHFLTETFSERLEKLSLSADQKASYVKENTAMLETCVFPAYKQLKDFLAEHADHGTNENGLYYFPNGTDYYAWLLRSEIGTDRSFEEIEALLETALKKDASTIAALVKEDPTLVEQQHAFSMDTSNPAGLTSYLSKRAGHDFPEIPDVSVEICDVPASMEAHLSPAFYLVPPLDNSDSNVVYLNNGYLTEDLPFFTTLAHESYPGHLYQTVYENATDPHPIHRLFYFGGYTEGWATYAEQLSYYYAPISENLATLLSSSRAMTLNLYSHLDLYVHAYGWTEEQCAAYLKKFGITGGQTAHNIFMLVKQQPANYLKYYLGYLEICCLRDQAKNALGEKFVLKEFHEFILDYGPAPFGLLEDYLQDWILTQQ